MHTVNISHTQQTRTQTHTHRHARTHKNKKPIWYTKVIHPFWYIIFYGVRKRVERSFQQSPRALPKSIAITIQYSFNMCKRDSTMFVLEHVYILVSQHTPCSAQCTCTSEYKCELNIVTGIALRCIRHSRMNGFNT